MSTSKENDLKNEDDLKKNENYLENKTTSKMETTSKMKLIPLNFWDYLLFGGQTTRDLDNVMITAA